MVGMCPGFPKVSPRRRTLSTFVDESKFNPSLFSWIISISLQIIRTGTVKYCITANYSVPCSAVQCSALQCTAVHCTALHCTALHCTALHCTALHCTALHCTALHCTALHCTALHCTALHCTALHCTALHCIYVEQFDTMVQQT